MESPGNHFAHTCSFFVITFFCCLFMLWWVVDLKGKKQQPGSLLMFVFVTAQLLCTVPPGFAFTMDSSFLSLQPSTVSEALKCSVLMFWNDTFTNVELTSCIIYISALECPFTRQTPRLLCQSICIDLNVMLVHKYGTVGLHHIAATFNLLEFRVSSATLKCWTPPDTFFSPHRVLKYFSVPSFLCLNCLYTLRSINIF